jgi:hypothetical protein
MRPFLTAALMCLAAPQAFADHTCDSKIESMVIEKRVDKVTSGYVDFIAESRVQRFTETARQFIWCITNFHEYHVAEFRWGTPAKEDKYFGAFVEPKREAETTRTDSSDIGFGYRQLKYRRLNSSSWKEIEPETIFPERLGGGPSLLRRVHLISLLPLRRRFNLGPALPRLCRQIGRLRQQ